MSLVRSLISPHALLAQPPRGLGPAQRGEEQAPGQTLPLTFPQIFSGRFVCSPVFRSQEKCPEYYYLRDFSF